MRRLLPVLSACAVLPFTAGCGAEKTVKNTVDPVAQAATKTAAVGTVELAISGKVSAAGQQIPIDSTGVVDFVARRGHMQVTTSVPGKGKIAIEEVMDGLVLYMRSDALSASLPAGKHWIKIDLQAFARKQGIDFAQLQQLGSSDPTQWLSSLRHTGSVEKIDNEDIKGAPTTHYRATIDLDKLAGNGAAVSSVRQLERLIGGKTMGTEVWIDRQGLVRFQTVDYTVKQPVAMRFQMAISYKRFGVPVDVQAPDAGDTVDLMDVVGG